jgi:transposase-like protein
MMQQLLAGVSTRAYESSLEARPSGRRTRGSSKSAVSRSVVRRTRQRLHEQLTRRLEGLEVVALFMDGVVVAQQTVIVVLGITRAGTKVPLGLRLGSTENAVVCTDALQDLLARGLTLTGRVLCVIDGGKGLRKGLGDVFGDAALIQRCQLHKGRNLDALVPTARQAYVRAALRRAYQAASVPAARRQLTALATWLERNGHADAAASVREGLEETLTVLKLGCPRRCAASLRRRTASRISSGRCGTSRGTSSAGATGTCGGAGSGSACCAPPSVSDASSGMESWARS